MITAANISVTFHDGIKAWSLIPGGGGDVYREPDLVLKRRQGQPVMYWLEDVGVRGRPVGQYGHYSEDQAATDMTVLEQLSVSKHSNVRHNRVWKKLYGQKSRSLYFESPNLPIQARLLGNYQTIPCHYCGLVLPFEMVEVDHRQPQAHPAAAVMKCLRAINPAFAAAGPTGKKATVETPAGLAHSNTIRNPASQRIPVKGRGWGNWRIDQSEAKVARYTISDQGKTFLTLCCVYWGDGPTQKKCLNNILNLVPACRICNGATGKGAIPYAV